MLKFGISVEQQFSRYKKNTKILVNDTFAACNIHNAFDLSNGMFLSFRTYLMSSNKCPWHLFSFQGLSCSAYWRAALKSVTHL